MSKITAKIKGLAPVVLFPVLFVLMLLAACGSQEDAPTSRPSTSNPAASLSNSGTGPGQPDRLPSLPFAPTGTVTTRSTR